MLPFVIQSLSSLRCILGAYYYWLHKLTHDSIYNSISVGYVLPLDKGAATRYDSPVRSLAIAMYIGQSYSVAYHSNVPDRLKSDEKEFDLVLFTSRFCRTSSAITQSERCKHITRPSPKGAATLYDSLVRSLAIALYIGQS